MGLALGELAIGNLSGLPVTEVEIKQLESLYPEMISRSADEFSETYFKTQSKDQNYIHLATHGYFDKNQPMYSYLLMPSGNEDDGRLTVDEIFKMNLNSNFVTLSACETALGEIGEGDELIGLSRAFIYAGTLGVVVSLWQVDDATTAWLMTRFHQYVNAGYTVSEALTWAQRDIIQRNFSATKSRGLKNVELTESVQEAVNRRNNNSSRDPYYWAPFVIIGNGFVH